MKLRADRREEAIAKIAEVTKTPRWVVEQLFDEYDLVSVDPALIRAAEEAYEEATLRSDYEGTLRLYAAKNALIEAMFPQLRRQYPKNDEDR